MKGSGHIRQQNNKGGSKFTRVNGMIKVSPVRVILDGQNLGMMPLQQAQELAYQHGLDLVEISPQICSIMDYGKYRFDQKKEKKKQQSKSKAIAAKEVRLRPVSGDHDVEIKINQIKNFLMEKRIVFVTVVFKNRELVHKDQGRKIIERIVQETADVGRTESMPRFEGKHLSVRLIPK